MKPWSMFFRFSSKLKHVQCHYPPRCRSISSPLRALLRRPRPPKPLLPSSIVSTGRRRCLILVRRAVVPGHRKRFPWSLLQPFLQSLLLWIESFSKSPFELMQITKNLLVTASVDRAYVLRPALVLLKKEAEKLTTFDGNFSNSAILEFVSTNKYPLVFKFSRETGPVIFEHSINKQVMLFATANESEKYIPAFEQAAKAFKGKIVFVYVESDNEDYGATMSDYFGITGASPKLIAYTGVVEGKKFLFDGELTLETVKTFATEFLAEKLQPFYKSEPIPEDKLYKGKIQ